MTSDERRPEWTPLAPRAVTLWRLGGLGVVGVGVAVLAVGEWLLRRADALAWLPVAVVPAAVAAVGAVVAIGAPVLAHRRWRYRLGERALELRRGVVVHRVSAVPYLRVQQVELAQGPLERWLGLTRVVVTTAAATTDGAVPGLSADAAERLRELVLERVGDDDAV